MLTTDEILCKWAEQRYGLENVTKVEFEDAYDGGWSEVTPGMGDYVAARATYGDPSRTKQVEAFIGYDWMDVIREIVQFTVELDKQCE